MTSSPRFLQKAETALIPSRLSAGSVVEEVTHGIVFRLAQDSNCDFFLFPCPVNVVAHFLDWM